jgi:HSP20 family molecular chaperone IbpA
VIRGIHPLTEIIREYPFNSRYHRKDIPPRQNLASSQNGDILNNEGLHGSGNFPHEPLFGQIIDEGNYFSVLAELPEIDEGKIRISLENNILTLMWHDQEMRHYKKEICLPCRTRLCNKKFKDGILKISLEKIEN